MRVIEFKNSKKKKANLIAAVLWIIYSIAMFYYDSKNSIWYKYLGIPLVIFYLLAYFLDKGIIYQIDNNIIKTKGVFSKSFDLNELKRINRNQHGMRLISEKQNDFRIEKSFLTIEDYNALESILKTYEKATEK